MGCLECSEYTKCLTDSDHKYSKNTASLVCGGSLPYFPKNKVEYIQTIQTIQTLENIHYSLLSKEDKGNIEWCKKRMGEING